jgi:hypothetical protein
MICGVCTADLPFPMQRVRCSVFLDCFVRAGRWRKIIQNQSVHVRSPQGAERRTRRSVEQAFVVLSDKSHVFLV